MLRRLTFDISSGSETSVALQFQWHSRIIQVVVAGNIQYDGIALLVVVWLWADNWQGSGQGTRFCDKKKIFLCWNLFSWQGQLKKALPWKVSKFKHHWRFDFQVFRAIKSNPKDLWHDRQRVTVPPPPCRDGSLQGGTPIPGIFPVDLFLWDSAKDCLLSLVKSSLH